MKEMEKGKMSGSEIRAVFLKYFEEHGHTVVSSSSLVPFDDPTLLFTNAGMNQFKDVFLGKATRSYTRAASAQKVVRAGGKHNDLENVGRTSRHHTFFEMLGNFSFGDYFKKEAISYAWDFLVNVLHLPSEKMFVTVYKDDDEAFNIWRDMIGLPETKIFRRGEKDNFWQMGDTGPCGPCSEIYIDQGEGTGCGSPDCNPECECDRHLEIWNLVFMQFNRDEKGVLHPLPKPSIDTGMGLERVASVVQKVTSNYDTDLFLPILDFIAELAGTKYGADTANDISMRVIADHARSTTFLISDGVMPSNEGRGYVLRRIMRRAMRHGSMLKLPHSFLYKVCLFVVDFMKTHYTELADKKAYIEKIVKAEEEAFSRTLNTGLKMIQEEILDKLPPNTTVTGEMIFKLYDTHGFPVDLLKDVLEDEGYSLDLEGFEKYMEHQQELAKKAGLGISSRKIPETLIKLGSKHNSHFDYSSLKGSGKILAIVNEKGEEVTAADGGNVDIILDKTVFYPEGGGQMGDSGTITTNKGHMEVKNSYRVENAIVHSGKIISGSFKKDDEAELSVSESKRRATEKNHTATHLLHKALKVVLGDHARQAGSQVSPDSLRFDFTHFGQLTKEELNRITDIVNTSISEGLNVDADIKTQEEAAKEGAVALFGEKYGDKVRVITVDGFSKELCGGTHVKNTSQIGAFVITSESSISSGIRRIEALTGLTAIKYLIDRSNVAQEVSQQLKVNINELPEKISEMQTVLKEHEKLIKDMKEQASIAKAVESLKAARSVNGVKVLTIRFDNVDMNTLRRIVDRANEQLRDNNIVLAGAVNDGKVSFVCRVSKDLVGKYKAGAIIKEVAKVAGGSGGGRDDMAQAGAKDVSKIEQAMEKIYELV